MNIENIENHTDCSCPACGSVNFALLKSGRLECNKCGRVTGGLWIGVSDSGCDTQPLCLNDVAAMFEPHNVIILEIGILKHCRENPFRWAMFDFLRKYLPFIRWGWPRVTFPEDKVNDY